MRRDIRASLLEPLQPEEPDEFVAALQHAAAGLTKHMPLSCARFDAHIRALALPDLLLVPPGHLYHPAQQGETALALALSRPTSNTNLTSDQMIAALGGSDYEANGNTFWQVGDINWPRGRDTVVGPVGDLLKSKLDPV
jgi:hypothetical protein